MTLQRIYAPLLPFGIFALLCPEVRAQSPDFNLAFYGRLGTSTSITAPIRSACAGNETTYLVMQDYTVQAFGANHVVPPTITSVTKIVASGGYQLALTRNARVLAWGSPGASPLNVPVGLAQVVDIAAGGRHALALRSNGTVVSWGDAVAGSVPVGLTGVIGIAASDNGTSIALKSNGTVVSWGNNSSGVYTPPFGLDSVTAIAGATHFIALRRNGKVVGWGPNASGAATVPNALNNVVAISASGQMSIARKADGTVVAWGNHFPIGTVADFPTSLNNNTVSMSAGDNHSILIRPGGAFTAWGRNNFSECILPTNLLNIKAVAAGAGTVLMVRPNGTVAARGSNTNGECNVPTTLQNAKSVAVNLGSAAALKTDGTVVTWGTNNLNRPVPAGLMNIASIASGTAHMLALKTDGIVVGWGANTSAATVPVNLLATAIAAGTNHSLAITAGGAVVAWGANGQGQTTVPQGLGTIKAISAGAAHSVALKANGTVVAWGDNSLQQCNVPSGLSNVVTISAGENHTTAVKADGSMVSWGSINFLPASVPAGAKVISSIACGSNFFVTIRGALQPVTVPISATVCQGSTYAFRGKNLTMAGTYRDTARATTGDTIRVLTLAVQQTSSVTLGNNGPLFVTETLNLTASAIVGATYAWTGPASFTASVQNPSRANVSITSGGRYFCRTTYGACNRRDSTNVVVNAQEAQPTITRLSASSGAKGALVSIFGTNFGTLRSVAFNGVLSKSISRVSSTQVNAYVPDSATTGQITIRSGGRSAASGTVFTVLTVVPVPIISRFSPASGPVSTLVTILGSNFNTATRVAFNGIAASFSLASPSQISVRVPSGATTGLITVITPSGTATSTTNFTIAGVVVASIVRFLPATGARVGDNVIVLGTGFSGATRLTFNGVIASVLSVTNDGQIVTIVPPGATTGRIVVTTPAGIATSPNNFPILLASPNARLTAEELIAQDASGMGLETAKFMLYPNPIEGPSINLVHDGQAAEAVLMGIDGKRLQTYNLQTEPATEALTLPAALPKGLYFIRVGRSQQKLLVR